MKKLLTLRIVVKIRLQAQHHSMADPLDVPRYRNAAHAAYTVVREEGFRTLWRGVSLTALRQATNQGVNFTAYTYMKEYAAKLQPQYDILPSWQHMLLGLVSGAMGPLSNAPIDTIKTRLQKSQAKVGESALARITSIAKDMFKQEGFRAFYAGITPRIMRVAPGQVCCYFLRDNDQKTDELILGRHFHRVRVHPGMDGNLQEGPRDPGVLRVNELECSEGCGEKVRRTRACHFLGKGEAASAPQESESSGQDDTNARYGELWMWLIFRMRKRRYIFCWLSFWFFSFIVHLSSSLFSMLEDILSVTILFVLPSKGAVHVCSASVGS